MQLNTCVSGIVIVWCLGVILSTDLHLQNTAVYRDTYCVNCQLSAIHYIRIYFKNVTAFTFLQPVPALLGWGQWQICQCSVPAETQQEVVSEQFGILFLCYVLKTHIQFSHCLALCQWCRHLVQKIKAQVLRWARTWSTHEHVDYLELVVSVVCPYVYTFRTVVSNTTLWHTNE